VLGVAELRARLVVALLDLGNDINR
jgi:hypothetical protein